MKHIDLQRELVNKGNTNLVWALTGCIPQCGENENIEKSRRKFLDTKNFCLQQEPNRKVMAFLGMLGQ